MCVYVLYISSQYVYRQDDRASDATAGEAVEGKVYTYIDPYLYIHIYIYMYMYVRIHTIYI